jgi:hypothetical protein
MIFGFSDHRVNRFKVSEGTSSLYSNFIKEYEVSLQILQGGKRPSEAGTISNRAGLSISQTIYFLFQLIINFVKEDGDGTFLRNDSIYPRTCGKSNPEQRHREKWRRGLQTVIFAQAVKKCATFYEVQRFINVFTESASNGFPVSLKSSSILFSHQRLGISSHFIPFGILDCNAFAFSFTREVIVHVMLTSGPQV